MAAVRTLTATLNRLSPARLRAGGWGWLAGSAQMSRPTMLAGHTPAGTILPAPPVRAEEDLYEAAGVEPHLEEMLRDPIVQSVMRADHVEAAEVRRMLKGQDPPSTALA